MVDVTVVGFCGKKRNAHKKPKGKERQNPSSSGSGILIFNCMCVCVMGKRERERDSSSAGKKKGAVKAGTRSYYHRHVLFTSITMLFWPFCILLGNTKCLKVTVVTVENNLQQ